MKGDKEQHHVYHKKRRLQNSVLELCLATTMAPALKPYANSTRCIEQVTLPSSMDEETETQGQGLDSRKRTLLALAVTGLSIYNKAMTH